jgi:hypothetical protein
MLYSNPNDLTATSSKNTLTGASRTTSDHMSGHYDPDELAHKINHHTDHLEKHVS